MKYHALFIVFLTGLFSFAQHYTSSETPFSRYMELNRTNDWVREDIEGKPFLFNENKVAEVVSLDGKKYVFPETNYQVKNDLFVYKSENAYYEIFPGQIKFIRIKDKGQYRTFIPKSNMPVLGDFVPQFYEVFTDNPNFVFVLVAYKKRLVPKNASQSYASNKSTEKLTYRLKKYFFIKGPDGFVRIKPNLNEIIRALHENKKMKHKLNKFIKQNKLKIRRPADLQKLMEYYYLKAREI